MGKYIDVSTCLYWWNLEFKVNRFYHQNKGENVWKSTRLIYYKKKITIQLASYSQPNNNSKIIITAIATFAINKSASRPVVPMSSFIDSIDRDQGIRLIISAYRNEFDAQNCNSLHKFNGRNVRRVQRLSRYCLYHDNMNCSLLATKSCAVYKTRLSLKWQSMHRSRMHMCTIIIILHNEMLLETL